MEGNCSFVASHQSVSNTQANNGLKQMGFEEKEAAVHEEMKRVNQLPSNSTYATNRMRILKKILQLLSIQNNITGTGVGVAFFWALYLSISAKSTVDASMTDEWRFADKALKPAYPKLSST